MHPRSRAAILRPTSAWTATVVVSAAIVVVVALALAIGWVATLTTRAATSSLPANVHELDLEVDSGPAVIEGSSAPSIQVRRIDSDAFGHAARERRTLTGGVLHIESRCPRVVVGSCGASYEVAVPESVTVHVRTRAGDVRITGFSGNASVQTASGDIDIEAYCGFDLSASSETGSVHVATACAPQELDLSTGSGDAAALVPPGRYRVLAGSGTGQAHVSGVIRDARAPFTLSVHSGRGSVTIEGGL